MSKFFITNQSIKKNKIQITGTDVNHIKNVLRKKKGETINICNADTSENYLCQIKELDEEKIELDILETLDTNVEPNTKITIFQALPKADKMELIIQKAVELGVNDITPVEMKRCVVKLNEKDENKKIQRWQKIAEVASKQSGRNIIPTINKIININQIGEQCSNYDVVLVAYEKEKQNKIKDELKKLSNKNKKNLKIAIVIGPEGGIEETEVEILKSKGAKIITLGDRILRTETVALNVISIIMYEFE